MLTVIFCSLASQVKTQAQEDPYCYMVDGSGQQQNLNTLCGTDRNVNTNSNRNANTNGNTNGNPNIDSDKSRKALPFAQQGRKYMQAEQYQEAISMFTQAVNLYPDYAEAYMGRAYSKVLQGIKGDSVIEDFRNAENAYGRRRQPDMVDNISRLIQQYRREKLGIVE